MSCKDGGERIVEISVAPLGGLFLFAYNDVTDQHRTEDLLRQSQKMEALGTMAGGVAHDFNNILTVIMSCTTLLKMHIAKDEKSDSLLNEIVASVERAADLTRSLLAFSRKQATKLEAGNLNKVVSTLEKSLRRLIREDIEFRIDPRDGAVPVLMDRSQIEQVIVNLVVNARDAMPSGGVLSISSSVTEVDGRGGRGSSGRDGARLVRASDRFGHRRRHGRGDAGAHLRTVLHDQGVRQGNGAGTLDRVRHRRKAWRFPARLEREGARDDLRSLPAA